MIVSILLRQCGDVLGSYWVNVSSSLLAVAVPRWLPYS